MGRLVAIVLAWIALLLLSTAGAERAQAHSSSTSYLTLATHRAGIDVQWEIALRDLDYAIGLDPTGRITWGDLRAHAPAIEDYALAHLSLSAGGVACRTGPVSLLADERAGTGFAVLRFTATCAHPSGDLRVGSTLMFDLDPEHRALLDVISGSAFHVAVLSPSRPAVTFETGGQLGRTFAEFFGVGVDHILSGPDHLLFIALLLFPAMFRRDERGRWQAVARFGPAALETTKILTMFTLAHAITVTAATLGWVDLPVRVTEGAIALTIALTALDNIASVLPRRRALLAFGFGLVHGMGFASALGPLSLPAFPLAVALFSFNLGVEAAQMLVAVVLLPLGFACRNLRIYPALVLRGASGVACLVALGWFAERTIRVF